MTSRAIEASDASRCLPFEEIDGSVSIVLLME
jgi:hypothetical protein